MDEQRTPERPEQERPATWQQPAATSEPATPAMPPVPGPPQGHPQGNPQAGRHEPMPAPWPPAAHYGAQQHGDPRYADPRYGTPAQPYGTHQYSAQFGGQPGDSGQGGQPRYPAHPAFAAPGAHAAAHRRGLSTGVVAGVTAGALAFGLVAGGGGVALFEYLKGSTDVQSGAENAAFDQGSGSGSGSSGSGSDGSGSDGSGSDGSGSSGSGSDGSGSNVSPFSGGEGGSSSGSAGGWGRGMPGGSGSDGSSGSQQTTTEPTSTQATGVVLIDSMLGYQGAESAGTGMVLTSDGLVLTNNHVVQGATSTTVTIGATGKTYKAEVVGTDKSKDVALLQLKDASGLATVTLDDDEGVATGDDVTAVGNAQGGGELVAAPGSVTATDQSMTASTESSDGSETLDGLIEFSAGVVSGDSGGPLLDSEGEVVGMTTAASTGGTSTVAYAIEITDALAIAHKIDDGQAGDGIVIGTPAFLGVAFSSGSTSGGATVQQVLSGTPAAKAGIAAGDTITKVGGKTVASSDALADELATYSPGDKVKVTWTSGQTGKTESATVTLVAGPAA